MGISHTIFHILNGLVIVKGMCLYYWFQFCWVVTSYRLHYHCSNKVHHADIAKVVPDLVLLYLQMLREIIQLHKLLSSMDRLNVCYDYSLVYEFRQYVKLHLNHYAPMTPYGDIHWGQHWVKKWLVAWRHNAIAWNNVDFFLTKFCDIHLRAISQIVAKLLVCIISWKSILLRIMPHLSKANKKKYLDPAPSKYKEALVCITCS